MSALSGWQYAQAEERWQRELERRRKVRPTVKRRSKLVPVERRPVENPAEARAAALESIRFTDGEAAYQRALRKAGAPKGRTSAQARRAKRRRTGGSLPVASWLEIAKAKRAKLRSRGEGRADIEGDNAGRYSDREIQALGEQDPPLALKRKGGRGFHYPIKDRRDLLAAIAAFGRATPSERSDVKAWIRKRAIEMGADRLLPKSWYTPPAKLHPSELQ